MNGLPAEIDLLRLIGATVTQMCFGQNQFIINLDPSISFAIESSCEFESCVGASHTIRNFPQSATILCELLGESIHSAMRDTEGGLIVRFANSSILHVLNDSKDYESFQIRIGSDLHVA